MDGISSCRCWNTSPEWYGRELVKVAPNHTSQDCWVCGWRNTDLKLSDRYWTQS
ncbi:zinc ribbon domain-containing protein [Pontibacter korlensis]|uniref:zinc ribbon domain-containing protein n=1 Tax=Pontibacter korlensis TaxID=400092 RepID=UPI000A00E52E